MCLIAVAHRASDRFPLIIAANRDEDYQRPSLPAQFWEGEDIIGGRDALHGGSWLGMTRRGRFAAVTNLRGTVKAPEARSRGELVTSFLREDVLEPLQYTDALAGRIAEYGGFHLLAGDVGGELAQLSGASVRLAPGIHGLSNAPAGVFWPKVEVAVESLRGALQSPTAEEVVNHLLRVLRKARNLSDPTRDLFITGDRYGTRASTVIVVSEGRTLFAEQNYGPGGVELDERRSFEFPITVAA